MRFDPDIIAGLQEVAWWRYRFSELEGLPIDDLPTFLPMMRSRISNIAPYEPIKIHLSRIPT
jgi:hypothetical protein